MPNPRKRRIPFRQAVALVLCVVCLGCGRNDLGKVEGTVSLDGKPLEGGSAIFYPAEAGPIAYSDIGTNGSYEIRTASQAGVLPGSYIATVSYRSGPPSPGMTLQQILALEKVPIRYCTKETSDLHVEVNPGRNSIDLKLITNK